MDWNIQLKNEVEGRECAIASAARGEQEAVLQGLQQRWEQELAEKAAKEAEELRLKELEELRAEQLKRDIAAATKIQQIYRVYLQNKPPPVKGKKGKKGKKKK